jgi:putative FmdB family regulatory protein
MPMYQYTCRSCGGDFEKKLRMSQAGETQACPSCDSLDTRKRIGAIAFTGGSSTTAAPARPVTSPFT